MITCFRIALSHPTFGTTFVVHDTSFIKKPCIRRIMYDKGISEPLDELRIECASVPFKCSITLS